MTKVWISNHNGVGGFYSCECIRDIWPWVNKLAVEKGIVKKHLDVMQGSYTSSYKGSALTHAGGGVLDIAQRGKALDDMLEEAGFADFERGNDLYNDSFGPHSHIILRSCPHLHWQAADQVKSWLNGRNGLVNNRRDPDQTRPAVLRQLAGSIKWLEALLAPSIAKTAVKASVTKNVVKAGGIRSLGAGKSISYKVTMGNTKSSKNHRIVIQRILNALRPGGKPYYDGPFDGVFGPKTMDALKKYRIATYNTTNPKVVEGAMGYSTFSNLVKWAGYKPTA